MADNVVNLFAKPDGTPLALTDDQLVLQCQALWSEARAGYLVAMGMMMNQRLRELAVGQRTVNTGIAAGTAREAREAAAKLLEVADTIDAVYNLMRPGSTRG